MKVLLVIILVVFAGAAGVMGFLQFDKQKKMEQEILDIKNRKDQTLKLDSLRSIVEARLYDSLANEFKRRDEKIKILENDLNKTRKQNAELQKLYNSIRVAMPEF